jgi:3-oxosteroid 1-dehydrogenase
MTTDIDHHVIVVGSGIGGMAAAIRAHELGATVSLVEKASHLGGATAWSGGQVWVGANHVAANAGLDDSLEDTLTYVEAIAGDHPELFDPDMAREWIEGAVVAARWYEEIGAIQWRMIPDYEDYYYPEAPGSRATGRYLTGQSFAGSSLGDNRKLILDAPGWPIGITYEEMFEWGGVAARDRWDADVMAERRRDDIATFGQGIASWFAKAVLDRGIDLYTDQPVSSLLVDDDRVVGIRSATPTGTLELSGTVILATGAHDWSPELADTYIGVPSDDSGSLAPPSVAGDGIALGTSVGAATASVPGTAAPITPGFLLPDPQFEGDSGFRGCYEHCMPHTILVNRAGKRFCDDSFHPAVIAGVMAADETGSLPNLPFYMVWDDWHHSRYGLGITGPGEPYVEGLVTSAPDLGGLAETLGVDPAGLVATVEHFNTHAEQGEDPDFGRGSNASVRTFRGDRDHQPNPNVGPITEPPFHGMRMRLLNTGIAAGGLVAGRAGRALRPDGSAIEGLYAVGECVTRTTGGGAGYNSGYSLCRAMTYGYLSATAIMGQASD